MLLKNLVSNDIDQSKLSTDKLYVLKQLGTSDGFIHLGRYTGNSGGDRQHGRLYEFENRNVQGLSGEVPLGVASEYIAEYTSADIIAASGSQAVAAHQTPTGSHALQQGTSLFDKDKTILASIGKSRPRGADITVGRSTSGQYEQMSQPGAQNLKVGKRGPQGSLPQWMQSLHTRYVNKSQHGI